MKIGHYYLFSWGFHNADTWFAVCIGPSKRFTQITLSIGKHGLDIHNNWGGQLGPNTLQILLPWKFWKSSYHSSPYP